MTLNFHFLVFKYYLLFGSVWVFFLPIPYILFTNISLAFVDTKKIFNYDKNKTNAKAGGEMTVHTALFL